MAFTDIYVDPSKQTRTAVTITNSTTTATVTQNGHGYSNSDTVKIQGATEDAYNGNFTISNVTTNTYDYTMGSDPLGSATGSPLASKLNLSGDDGTTSALAWADLQYALDQTTRDATNGDRFNVKAGTAEVLTAALDMTTYGSAAYDAPVLIQGYTSAAGDGGKGEIDGNATYSVFANTTYENIYFIDMKMGNCGSASHVLGPDRFCGVYSCEIHGCTGDGISATNGSVHVVGCYIHDIGASGFYAAAGSHNTVTNCYFKNGTTNQFTYAIRQNTAVQDTNAIGNIFSLDSSSIGFYSNSWGLGCVIGNSFYTTGTGSGISAYGLGSGPVINNLFEGFTDGIKRTSTQTTWKAFGIVRQNAFYDCTSNINTDTDVFLADDNESLVSSPFAKTGSLPTDFTSATFWDDVYAYFAPVDIGNVYTGFPAGANQTKGAVGQPVGGGGGTYSLHPLAYN